MKGETEKFNVFISDSSVGYWAGRVHAYNSLTNIRGGGNEYDD